MNKELNQHETQKMNYQAWLMAIRPRTLPAAAAGVVMGCALAWYDGYFNIWASIVCLMTALLLQIGSNLANDVFDYERGLDTEDRLGPTRVTQAGLLTPRQVKGGMIIVFGLATLLGLYLAVLGGWPIILMGAASILAAIFYTAGPIPLGYYGLGDIFVFIFFGLVAVVGTYFVQAGTTSADVWWMAVPLGLLITNILVVNNLRDLEYDRKGHKHTVAVVLGKKGTQIQYLLFVIISYLIVVLFAWEGIFPWATLLSWLSLVLAIQATWLVFTQTGRPLNAALGKTGQAALAFSLLFWLGLFLA